MTHTLAEPNDTGEIPPPTALDETLRIDLERTRNLGPQIAHVMNVSPNLRSADATEIIPLFEDPILVNPARPADLTDVTLTGEILALDDRPYPKPPPLPKPKWAQPASHHALVRRRLAKPKPGRGRHRAAAPKWTGRLIWSGSVLFVLAAAVVAVLAVIR